jgi:hypothetical protein
VLGDKEFAGFVGMGRGQALEKQAQRRGQFKPIGLARLDQTVDCRAVFP